MLYKRLLVTLYLNPHLHKALIIGVLFFLHLVTIDFVHAEELTTTKKEYSVTLQIVTTIVIVLCIACAIGFFTDSQTPLDLITEVVAAEDMAENAAQTAVNGIPFTMVEHLFEKYPRVMVPLLRALSQYDGPDITDAL